MNECRMQGLGGESMDEGGGKNVPLLRHLNLLIHYADGALCARGGGWFRERSDYVR